MKKFFALALVLGFVAVTAHVSYATHVQTQPGDIAGGIVDSRHNFSSSGVHYRTGDTTFDNRSGDLGDGLGTTEICVFCHTPHHGIKSGSAPLWNKALGATGYTGYGTLDTGQPHDTGDALPTTGSSIACLACHDGTRAFDNMINAPGKGTWNGTKWTSGVPTPAVGTSGSAGDMGFMFSENGILVSNKHNDSYKSRHNLARGGLGNDHPINVTYRGRSGQTIYDASVSGARASLRRADAIFKEHSIFSSTGSPPGYDPAGHAEPLVCADRGDDNCNMWAVNGFIKTDASINDILNDGKVECCTCHDAHYRNQTNPEIDTTYGVTIHPTNFFPNGVDGLFLRRVGGNSDSGLCRTCHAK